ncbi:MAG: DUF456 domain-containing protein [Spirochaetaceae bacterium]|jgi:uncharacterized protein YqgC (DUF456 family)|nr:DUF456 domain-containing protein [Spirochaetaceae bacterium]
MNIVLVVFAFLFLIAGLLGSVVPVIPGPPLSYLGLLLLQWSGFGGFSIVFLAAWGVITAAITIMDNFLPAWLTKRFGGSRKAVIGSVLGLILGMIFFAPYGIIIGSFLGALAGELLNNKIANNNAGFGKALKVAFGAFLAFIVGTGAKLFIGISLLYYAIKAMF